MHGKPLRSNEAANLAIVFESSQQDGRLPQSQVRVEVQLLLMSSRQIAFPFPAKVQSAKVDGILAEQVPARLNGSDLLLNLKEAHSTEPFAMDAQEVWIEAHRPTIFARGLFVQSPWGVSGICCVCDRFHTEGAKGSVENSWRPRSGVRLGAPNSVDGPDGISHLN